MKEKTGVKKPEKKLGEEEFLILLYRAAEMFSSLMRLLCLHNEKQRNRESSDLQKRISPDNSKSLFTAPPIKIKTPPGNLEYVIT